MKSFTENFRRSPDFNDNSGCGHTEHLGKGKEFRCPFHTKGEKENTIINLELGEDRESNIELITKSLENFYNNPKNPALRFRLPDDLKEICKNLEDLKQEVLSYQADITAGELSYRLKPFLPHQFSNYTREEFIKLIDIKNERPKAGVASLLLGVMEECGFKNPTKASDISIFIELIIRQGYYEGKSSPSLTISDYDINKELIPVMIITPGSLYIHPDVEGEGKNKDSFQFVMNPFYPKEFGRYSENVEIVITRMSDIRSLSKEAALAIREKSNLVLKEHGVAITDVKKDAQHQGVWIPKYVDN